MSLTLDATLQAAQDGQTHRPIIEIISSAFLPDIPFDGNLFNELSDSETKPNIIVASSGRVIGTVIRSGQIIVFSTDTSRMEWSEYGPITSSTTVQSACPVELENGNIGIAYIEGTYALKVVTISQAGEIVAAPATVTTHTSAVWIADVHVSRQADAYRMVYSFRDDADPAVYSILLRTSADFATWSSSSAIPLSGLLDSRRKGNPSLLESSATGELFLFFDYVDDIAEDGSEIVNVYHQTSDDHGSTWTAPAALTSYSVFGTDGYHPSAAERIDGSIEVAWTERNNVLRVDGDTSGYQYYGTCAGGELFGTDFHYDPATGKLYVKSIYSYTGYKSLCSVVVVDVETWTIEKCYTPSTIPAYNTIFATGHVWWHRWYDEGQYVAAGIMGGKTAMVIDTVADTVTTYQFLADDNDNGLVKNVDTDFTGNGTVGLQAGYLDAASQRFYLLFINSYLYTHKMWLGYIDITETADPITGKYSWHQVFESNLLPENQLVGFNQLRIIPELGYAMLAFHNAASNWYGRLLLVSLNSGGIVKDYYNPTNPGFHHNGIWYPCYWNGKIYGGFTYRSDYDMADRRGLMQIDLASDSVRYHIPTYATRDDYGMDQTKPTGDGRILIGTYQDGVVLFDTSSETWEQYNNDSLPGLTPTGHDSLQSVDYDPLTGTIFAGAMNRLASWQGLSAFSIYGAFHRGKYRTGEEAGGTWSFGDAASLTAGTLERENSIAVDPQNGLWTLWTHAEGSDHSVMWDHEEGASVLSDYLVNGQPATVEWSVDAPNRLTFTLSHGHLFDPHNQMSVLSPVLRKGRKVTLRLGETVGGSDYWQNQGSFVVKETSMSYRRGDYPVIQAVCEDKSAIWEECNIVATEAYDDAPPDQVVSDIVEQYGGLDSSDIEVGEFASSHNLFHQFLDQSVAEMLEIVLDHFGYFPHFNVEGKFEPRRIDLSAGAAHSYSGTASLIDYTPDDTFSTYTNRVVVTGEGRYFLEVLYDEEVVGSMSGVIGWWGENQVKRLWYSEDHERVCRNPRLEIIQSIEEFWLFKYMGGGREAISATDYYERWVEITVEGPDLTMIVIAEVAAVLAIGVMAITCEFNCGIYTFMLSLSVSVLFYTLACVAGYSYNVWARPLGKEKQTIQAQADDYALQRELGGQIVEVRIDDPLCYEVAHCQRVADQELEVVKAQRRRVRFAKTAHLQDEVGDVIQIVHPYSGVARRVFITNLSRSYTKPEEAGVSESGGVVDTISGWMLT